MATKINLRLSNSLADELRKRAAAEGRFGPPPSSTPRSRRRTRRDRSPIKIAEGRRLAAARGFEVVGGYQDEAASAYHGDRGAGLAECERQAAGDGTCALIVQHSDRLARRDAKQARHLIEVVLWAIKNDAELLSAQDPEMLAGGDMALLLGAIGGMRNHQDSKRKSLAVKDGRRRRVQAGRLPGRQ